MSLNTDAFIKPLSNTFPPFTIFYTSAYLTPNFHQILAYCTLLFSEDLVRGNAFLWLCLIWLRPKECTLGILLHPEIREFKSFAKLRWTEIYLIVHREGISELTDHLLWLINRPFPSSLHEQRKVIGDKPITNSSIFPIEGLNQN